MGPAEHASRPELVADRLDHRSDAEAALRPADVRGSLQQRIRGNGLAGAQAKLDHVSTHGPIQTIQGSPNLLRHEAGHAELPEEVTDLCALGVLELRRLDLQAAR